MNLNQNYQKSIFLKEPIIDNPDIFNLHYLVYNGKLSIIADYFNKLSIEETIKIVNEIKEAKSCLQISAFLGFQNIFLYLLTFDSDIYHSDNLNQNVCHSICYKGEIKLLLILFNFLRFRLKMETIEAIENLKKTYNFSKLDVNKGKLSRAVNHTETNLRRFDTFQNKLRDEVYNLIAKCLKIYQILFSQRDEEGRNPLHYAAMSKFPLCYLIVDNFLEFDLLNNNGWEEFINLFEDLQNLEVKQERVIDPRRCNRLEKELTNLLGESILIEVKEKFKNGKNEIIKCIINSKDRKLDNVLHVSSFHGDYRIINKLLIYSADKTAHNKDRKLPVDLAKDNFVRKSLTNLNKAAKNSDSKNITELVHFGNDINSKISIFNQGPIHKVIESNKVDKYIVLQKMLDMGADPNIPDSNGWTALHYCAELGDLESVKILLNSKSKIDCYSNNKRTPLHFAAQHNFSEIVRYILEKASDIFNNKEFYLRTTIKNMNISNKISLILNKNIDENINININKNQIDKDKNNDYINSNNNLNIKSNDNNQYEKLNYQNNYNKSYINTNNGIPDAKNTTSTNFYSKSTIATNFCDTNRLNSASNRFNLDLNKNPNKINKSSIISNNNKNQSNSIIDKNELIFNKKDSNGCTSLHLAAKHGSVQSLGILLAFGSDLYAEDFRKWNILHYAAFQGHRKAVRFISRYDCDFSILKNTRNSQNKLAIEIIREHTIKQYFNNIWEASKEGQLDLVRQLLNEGENINEKSTFLNNTPLHLAVLNNHYLMVRLLLQMKAHVKIKNRDLITVEEYSDLINIHISGVYSKYMSDGLDIMKIDIDWKEIVKNIVNTNEKTLNALISTKTKKVKLWKMMDFSQKINKLFKDAEKEELNNLIDQSLIIEEKKNII